MSFIFDFYRSPMGKKVVMAVTGLMLFGFVLGHMVGNLKLYKGLEPDGVYALDHYAEGLREIGAPIFGPSELLWIARIGLLAAVLLHILSAYQLTRISQQARPEGYREKRAQAATYASRTMRWGGVILLLFVIYHLLHLTFGSVHPDFEAGKVYANVVKGFSNPLVSAFYIVANLALGLHLYHGLWSLLQTLGVAGENIDLWRQRFAAAFALVVTAGNISFPLAVLFGFVQLGA